MSSCFSALLLTLLHRRNANTISIRLGEFKISNVSVTNTHIYYVNKYRQHVAKVEEQRDELSISDWPDQRSVSFRVGPSPTLYTV